MRTGGKLLVDQLVVHGVDIAFGVPGESYLAVLDALYDAPIRFVACRHEVGAANMADAYGKLTGRPGICMVTRGPGATHAAGGIHTAFQDSTPLILLVGQVGREMMGREAFQEIDYRHMFGPMAKWVEQIDDPGRIPELVSRAFHVATCRPPGAGRARAARGHARRGVRRRRREARRGHPRPPGSRGRRADAGRCSPAPSGRSSSSAARRGASRRTTPSPPGAPRAACPVASGWRRQDYVDNSSDAYVGHLTLGADPRLAQRVRDADVLLVIGDRLSEITTAGYTLLTVPDPAQALIHVTADPDELGRVYTPALGVTASPDTFARALSALAAARARRARGGDAPGAPGLPRQPPQPPDARRARHGRGDGDRARAGCRPMRSSPTAPATSRSGRTASTSSGDFPTQLAPTSGAMGYGVPAARRRQAAPSRPGRGRDRGRRRLPDDRPGARDAVQYDAPIVVLIVNNGMFGTIRMHQERHYPGRVSGTDLVNPDFAALAQAFGAHGAVVERTEDFAAAFDEALARRTTRRARAARRPRGVDAEAIADRDSRAGDRRRSTS